MSVTILDDSLSDRTFTATTSQFGEDAVIAEVLSRLDVSEGWWFELGAMDGDYLRNTLPLERLGWPGVLVECDESKWEKLSRHQTDRVHCVQAKVTTDLDDILDACGCPQHVAVGSIDTDSNEFEIWEHLKRKPLVMVVEFQASETIKQATYDEILGLGVAKGYAPIAKTFCNLIFVDKEVW